MWVKVDLPMAFRIVARGVAGSAIAGDVSTRATRILMALQEEFMPGDRDARQAVLLFSAMAPDAPVEAGRALMGWLDQRDGKGMAQHAAE